MNEETIFGFNVLKMPYAPDEWCDADDRMFEACFAILRQFVEDELGKAGAGDSEYRGYRLHAADIGPDDLSGMPPQRSSDKDAIDLWLWYRDDLPALEADYDADIMRCYGGGGVATFLPTDNPMLREIKVTPRAEPKYPYDFPGTVKDKKLQELIALRRSLWT